MLCHGVGGRCRRCHLDHFWIADKFVAEFLDIVGQGGRKEQRLAQGWQQPDNTFNIGNESHVQHPVSFVNHQNFYVGQQHLAAFKMVEQAAGCGNQNINTLAQGGVLVGKADPANQQRHRQLVIGAEFFKGVRHLGGKFAGRGKDQ